MKRNKKIAAVAVAACLAAGALSAFVGCKSGGGFQYTAEKLSTMDNYAQEYNSNLFYVNALEFQLADPDVIYVTEGKGKGWFYAYGTSDEIGGLGIQSWRSKDLAHWECTGVALFPDYGNTWAVDCYWAPEVIYDSTDKLYYMFYNAYSMNEIIAYGDRGEPIYRLCLSVAYSETPDGPFVAPTGKNSDGKQLSPSESVYDLRNTNPELGNKAMDCALDASPFIDPVTGKKYLYFGYYNQIGDGTHLYGMEMKDWYTPDYSTLTELTRPNYSSLDQPGYDLDNEGRINEGPHMMYHGGKYYLTFSVNDYREPDYSVFQAISDSPLGTYVKVPANDGGKLLSTDFDWEHAQSAGHHAFINVGDETLIAYHTFLDRMSIAEGRALAIDRIVWTTNSEGKDVMHTNGPTWSLQALPEAISGYKNIAPQAEITANNSLTDESLLTDGLVKYQDRDLAEEYEAEDGTSIIKLTWDDWKTARAIMVYNSWDYELAFESIKKIDIEYMKSNGSSATVTIKNVSYDKGWFVDDDYEVITPGGSAIVEFNEMPVKSVTITIDSKEEGLALSEIVVLGKDEPCDGIKSFKPYSYINGPVGSPHLVNTSKTFGTVTVDGEASALETMYGFDLTHDDGTGNAYIEQKGARNQYAYFNGIFDTAFYAEAAFTVTGHSFANDAAPKFGFAVSREDSTTAFFYIDAQNDYTLGQVGYVPSAIGSNNKWDFENNEVLQEVPGIAYKDGHTVKLAVLRQGEKFYFLCNDELIFETSDFAAFGDYQRAAVGFLSFNTPMKISNYFATADSGKIAEKLAEFKG